MLTFRPAKKLLPIWAEDDEFNVIRLRPLLPEIQNAQPTCNGQDKLEQLLHFMWAYLLRWYGLEYAEMLPEAIESIHDSKGNLHIDFASDAFLSMLRKVITEEWYKIDVLIWQSRIEVRLNSPHCSVSQGLDFDSSEAWEFDDVGRFYNRYMARSRASLRRRNI